MKLPEKIKMMSITSSTHDSNLANKINEIINYLASLEEQKKKYHEFQGIFDEAKDILEQNNMTNTQQEKQWIQECPRCGGKEWSIPEFICDKCKWQDPVVQENKDQSNTMEDKLREEFNEKCFCNLEGRPLTSKCHYDKDLVADWWLSKFNDYKSTLQQQVEGKKREIPLGLEPDEHEEVRAFNAVHNQAIDKVLKIISDSK